MTPIQAVLTSRAPVVERKRRGTPADAALSHFVVNFVPNPDSRTPWQIASEIPGGHVPDLTSPDFLRLATLAKKLGFQVVRFLLMDRRFSLLPEYEQDEISRYLVTAFQEDGAYGVQLMMSRDYPDYFFNGIDLYAGGGDYLDVRSDGVLMSNNRPRIEDFFRTAVAELAIA